MLSTETRHIFSLASRSTHARRLARIASDTAQGARWLHEWAIHDHQYLTPAQADRVDWSLLADRLFVSDLHRRSLK